MIGSDPQLPANGQAKLSLEELKLKQKFNVRLSLQIGFFVILVGFVLILSIINLNYRSELQEAQKHNNELINQIKILESSIWRYERLLRNRPRLWSWDIERFKKKGLKQPQKDIIADLRKHNELIPYEGVRGGRMGFYFEDNIWVLTKKWVLAYFEDGHIDGYMLLEYQVSDDGKISWKVIKSYLD